MERSELEFELSEEIWKLYPGLKMSDYDKIAKLSVQKVLDNIDEVAIRTVAEQHEKN